MIRTPGCFRLPRLIAMLGVAMISSGLTGAAARGRAAETFTLTEHFGVAHPEQIITFDLAAPIDPKKTAVTMAIGDAAAVPVPLQVLADGKKLAVRTSLGAGETRTFAVKPGTPAAAGPDAVTVRETDAWYEIANGLTGVRVPKPVTALPFPAPVQGVLLRDGTWTAAGAKLSLTPPEKAEPKMTVRFLERGPLKTVVTLRYDLGTAFSTTTIALEAGQPTVMFEEEADLDRSYAIELHDAVHPTHARYRGHHASSKAGGYEPDGQVYRQWHQRPSLDAQVDLTFAGPRGYGRVARWDPWITDCGWYWQLFDDKAGPESNLVGAFAGRASRQVGSAVSGVGGYTAPAGMSDLVTAVAADGTVHCVYAGAGGLWHVALDRSLTPGKPAKIAAGLVNPDLAILADGSLCVVAYDSAAKQFVELKGRAGGTFKRSALAMEGADGATIADPFAYQAVRGDTQFLFFFGSRDGKTDGLLFSRSGDEAAFTFRDAIGELAYYRHINRPRFAALPDGRVLLLTTDKGGYANLATIATDAVTFTTRPSRVAGLNFGVALDRASGSYAAVDQTGTLHDYPSSGQPAKSDGKLPVDHHGQGANRRSLATAPDGTALLLFGGNSESAYQQSVYRRSGSTWAAWPEATNLGLACTQAVFHQPSGKFLLLGREQGKLAAYACKPGETSLAKLFDIPETEARRAGFSVAIGRYPPDARFFKQPRFQWGLFTGTKGSDLKPATEIQPIARQMNLHGGINLEKIQRYTLDFPDPPQGYGAMYMPKPAVEALIAKLRADTKGIHGGGFHSWLYNAEPMGRGLIDFWADTTGKQAAKLTGEVESLARTFLDHFVTGDGIYAVPTHYWHGGLEMSRKLVWLDQLMGSDQTTPEQKTRLKAIAVLFGSILYDDDFAPLGACDGINLGTPNMPIQQQNYRQMYALFLARHPLMKERAKGVAGAAKHMLASTVNEHGAHMGSLHYVGAANGPLLATFQQLQMAGIYDGFASEERLAKFAEFYMQALSPPEVRFGGKRLMVAIGDGCTEGTEEYGMLGTGFAKTNPALSKRLMGAWRENGKVHTGFHGSTLLKIDDELPGESPKLTDARFPGYYSILRSGWGTPEENAVWCVNGNFYVDHGHNDLGAVIAYLLGAPVSIDWGPIYSPRVSGGVMHSGVIQEAAFGQAWDKDIASLDAGVGFSGHYGNHGVGEATALDVFPKGRRMVSTIKSGLREGGKPEDVTSWVRTVTLVTADPELPVLVIKDTFSGKDAAAPKIFTLNLMADGAVETPAGPQTPPVRMHPAAEKPTDPATQMPSAGKVFPLSPGVNRLGFTGQTWKGHPTEGIDWDCYVIPQEPQQAQIGNWANQASSSASLFQAAQGRPFEERQHILRVRGTGSFTTVIVPWKKGKKPEGLTVDAADDTITVKTAASSVTVDAEGKIR
jgi:hypothetical protein